MIDDHHQQSREEVQRDEKSEEVDSIVWKSYPFLCVAGLAIGIFLGGNLIGGVIGSSVGFVVEGGIGWRLQALVTSRRKE